MTLPTVPSYLDETFFITDPVALVRDDDLAALVWKRGQPRPEDAKIGDKKRIPQHTEMRLTAHRTGVNRSVYVYAEPAEPDPRIPTGWTRATNFEGQLLNELLGYQPLDWDLPPDGSAFTVTDANALIRSDAPRFRSKGETIPVGAYVIVVESSDTEPPGKYVRVHAATVEEDEALKGDEIGWTAASNLTHGFSPAFGDDDWLDQKGTNAAWRRGSYAGARVLVNVVGTGGQLEQLALWTLGPYLKMVKASAKRNLSLGVTSGFRTYGHQEKLYKAFKAGKGNLAAKPGRSNHQHGQAFDLNTRGFDTPIYDWLAKHGPKHGFVRTVKKEHWHWEYRPEEAAKLAAQGRHCTWA